MELVASEPSPGLSNSLPSPASNVDPGEITKPILKAIDRWKVALMLRIDHQASECTLICHDLDKIGGILNTAEEHISEVEVTTTSHIVQLADLQELVRSLQNQAGDAENRQRCNNMRVVELPEGAE